MYGITQIIKYQMLKKPKTVTIITERPYSKSSDLSTYTSVH